MYQAFLQYLQRGGFPYLKQIEYDPQASSLYLQELFEMIEMRDISARYAVRNYALLERLLLYVLSTPGQTFSALSLSKCFKNEGIQINSDTILSYLRYAEEAFLLYRVKREDALGKKILSTQEKYYVVDHGLREAVFHDNMAQIQMILENIVFLELLRLDYQITIGKSGQLKVDFIARKNGRKVYIQVCYMMADPETRNREFKVFDSIRDNHPKVVLSMDPIQAGQNGYLHRSIIDFLLHFEDPAFLLP